MSDSEKFVFSEKDLLFNLNWDRLQITTFNLKLEKTWLSKQEKDCFRYHLNIRSSHILEGEHGFFAQLNVDRAVSRRTPDQFWGVNQPMRPQDFNFTKANDRETMFSINKLGLVSQSEDDKSYFLINVSPLEQYHCLLLPSLNKLLPQVLTEEALYLGISSVLLNGSVEQRAGFNSLCGYASVNHLHLHTYYLNQRMKLETIEVEHLINRCYVLENYPAKGYVFQIATANELEECVRDIYRLTKFFTDKNVAHNLFITRGLSFDKSKLCKETSERDCVRVYVWARTSSLGAKSVNGFNPALCELFGHLVVKTEEDYNNLTEEAVAVELESITHEPYTTLKNQVKELYKT